MGLDLQINGDITEKEVIALYRANDWSSAEKPKQLLAALRSSHSLVTARDAEQNHRLVGLANAISDGHLVVYYPHMLVLPEYQGKGVGQQIMQVMQSIYADFHQQMLTADGGAIQFYEKQGFSRAGQTEPMWIYAGNDH